MPLVILRFPLAIVAALVLDASDNTLLAHLTDVNLGPAYKPLADVRLRTRIA